MPSTMNKKTTYYLLLLWALMPVTVSAQNILPDSTSKVYSLNECISLALQNQPAVKQALIDEDIEERQIKADLSGWSPQISATANLTHYLELPTAVFPDQSGNRRTIQIGVYNSSNVLLEARQPIFNNDLILASRNSKYMRLMYDQNTEEVKISTVVAVSKAYYDVLIAQEQTKLLQQVLQRQQKQLDDAKALYDGGLVDPTDYKRATIALNNTQADLKRNLEMLKYKYAYLHQLMGIDASDLFMAQLDRQSMESDMMMDVPETVDVNNRIEMKQLETQKRLQQLDISAQKWSLFPSISAFANRNHIFQNDNFSQLYSEVYPNSQVGLTLSLPLFQGTRRFQTIQQQKLIGKRLELDIVNTTNTINSQYAQALALYNSYLNDYNVATENVALSEEVYNTIKLQYNEGIKTYLDLMTAETDLREAQLNQLDAMLNVLSSKLDVQQSLGTINTNQ